MTRGFISWADDRPPRNVDTIAAAVAVITGFRAQRDNQVIYFREPRQSECIITLWTDNGLINIKVSETYPDCDRITADVRAFMNAYRIHPTQ